MKEFGQAIVAILIGISLSLLAGYVFMLNWNWFMVPILNMPILGFGYAYALFFMLKMITRNRSNWMDEDFKQSMDWSDRLTRSIVSDVVMISGTWLFGYIIQQAVF